LIELIDDSFIRLTSEDEEDYRNQLQKLLDDFEYSIKEF